MPSKPPDITRLAHSYRRLVLWFGVQLILTFVSISLSVPYHHAEPPAAVAIVSAAVSLCIIGTLLALAIYAYRAADALGSPMPALWVVAMVVPFINAISLLVLSSRSTAACRACGISVGLLGPKVPAQPATPLPPVGPT